MMHVRSGTRFLILLVLALGACNQPPAEPVPDESTIPLVEGEEAAEMEPEAEAPSAPAETPAPKPAPSAEPARRPEPQRQPEPEPTPEPEPEPEPGPAIVEVEVPSGMVLGLELLTALDSSVNRVGDEIQARTLAPLYLDGQQVLGSGALVEGRVTQVQASGRVKGRASLGITFDRLRTPTGTEKIRTSIVQQEAEGGEKKDAAVIGGAAGVGAIVGGIIGGKKGAAIGATVGGAGGTGVVLTTRGEEIRLPVGTELNVRLEDPVTIEVH